ncbi:phosphate acetyltransferase [Lapillicoccus sp.]|uniref:phosphate acetyltransferase n=1 Tax=Lapillicoccus sp. TaxID=1909287 RepID=UPI003266EF25
MSGEDGSGAGAAARGRSVYLASSGGRSGKSAVALGLLDQLSRRVGRVGVFRPIIRTAAAEQDHVLDLLLSRLEAPGTEATDALTAADAAGVCYDDVHHDPEAAMSTIVDRYHWVAARFDAVLVIGSDYTDVASPTEFSYNARIAANLDSPMVLVVAGDGQAPEQVRTAADIAAEEARHHHASVLAVIANRVAPQRLEETTAALQGAAGDAPAYAIPAEPLLDSTTVRELMTAVDGSLVHGDDALLDRESPGVLVAAMTMPNVLERLFEGCVVISPSDRADVLLGLLLAYPAKTFPSPAAIVLNGGLELPDSVSRLVAGLDIHIPVVTCAGGTMSTAAAFYAVQPRLTRGAVRKIETALTLFDKHVDGAGLLDRLDVTPTGVVTPLMFEHRLMDRARAAARHIVLPEGEEPRILKAADQLLRREVVQLTLLGSSDGIRAKASQLGLDISRATLVDPHDEPLRSRFAQEYAALRADKGVTMDQAWDVVVDPSYFGTMMVLDGLADGMVSGAIHTTAHTIRPALEVVKTAPGVTIVSSVFLMCLPDRVLVYGDCAVNPDPTAEQLADIAISSAATATQFGIEPRVAMLSYATGGSGSGVDVDKVRAATTLVRSRAPELSVEGPIQYDAAVDMGVAATKLKDSPVAGRATVLIFPDLNTGNNTYKAVQRSAGAVAVGPVLQGLRKPVNDLSRGALVEDIVNTVAITAIQAEGGS